MAHDFVFEGNSPLAHLLRRRYCWTPGWTDPAAGIAAVPLPDGALLQQLQFWGYDTDPDWLTVSLLETCQGVGFDPPSTVGRRIRRQLRRDRDLLRIHAA